MLGEGLSLWTVGCACQGGSLVGHAKALAAWCWLLCFAVRQTHAGDSEHAGCMWLGL
jgi:hypothetical protein